MMVKDTSNTLITTPCKNYIFYTLQYYWQTVFVNHIIIKLQYAYKTNYIFTKINHTAKKGLISNI